MRALLADPAHGAYYVACKDGIIGQMMHTREWSDWRNGDIWWIQSVYVHPDHRRQGVCRALHTNTCGRGPRRTPGWSASGCTWSSDNARAQAAYAAHSEWRPGGYLVMQDLFGD